MQDLNKEFEEHLRRLYGEKCTADCNEVIISRARNKKNVAHSFLIIFVSCGCLYVCVCLSLSLSLSIYIYIYIFQMARLPQGITELVRHEKLPVPLVCDLCLWLYSSCDIMAWETYIKYIGINL